MPQHKSAEKRVRQNAKKRLQNRLHKSRVRTMIKKLSTASEEEQVVLLNDTKAYLDRLACKGVFHKNKVARTKGQLERMVTNSA